MIDIFPQIYSELKSYLEAFFRSVAGKNLIGNRKPSFHDEYPRSEQDFPCVTIEEKRNANSEGEMDLTEKRSEVMYEINIYDNGKRRKEVCRTLFKIIDEYMATRMGFLRVVGEPFPNIADSTVYRYLLRYEGYVDNETGNISRTK